MKATEKQAKTSKNVKKSKKKLPLYYRFGRPTKYKTQYCKDIVKYFDVPYFVKRKEIQIIKGIPVEVEKDVPNRIPLLEGFARSIGVHVDTAIEWTKVHREFSEAYRTAKGLQKEMLVYLSANNYINPTYAVFLTKNITDLKDRVETDITSGGEKVESVNLSSVLAELKNKSIDELQRET